MSPIVIAVVAFVVTSAIIWTYLLVTAKPEPESEAPRDITIGKDQHTPDRLERLRAIQGIDIDVSRKARPTPPTHAEKQRQASSHLTRGF